MSILWKSYDFSGHASELLELFRQEKNVFLLESSLRDPARGRYSFIGFDPFRVIKGQSENSLSTLRDEFSAYRSTSAGAPSPFSAGMVGFLSYDFGLKIENIERRKKIKAGLPDYCFGFYDSVITIDHLKRKLHISSTGWPEKNARSRQLRAQERLKSIADKLNNFIPMPYTEYAKYFPQHPFPLKNLKSNLTKAQYLRSVQKALRYIAQGDIYQVNLSQQFCFNADGHQIDAPALYKVLRQTSPSCFGGYFDAGAYQIVSSSPESFLRLRGNAVETRPMKGTRPRGENKKTDRQLKAELLKSKKDKAELLMITDLERNDLGRVCQPGSVKVKEMRTLEEYATVYQATSTVEGKLRKDKDCFDLIEATFPGGSITGCPKIRAMQIIEELEPASRGIYTGSFGYISFSGQMDLNILIRTLLVQGKKIYYNVGGGIVADSSPENEYKETLVKAKAMKDCLVAVFSRKKVAA